MFQSLCKIVYEKYSENHSLIRLNFIRFIRTYRLPQPIALLLIGEIQPFAQNIGEIPLEIQILSVLNFYATGSYQQ